MDKVLVAVVCLLVCANCKTTGKNSKTPLPVIPANLSGDFKDDYGISYTINDSVWIQHPSIKYHLVKYDSAGKYFIAKNDKNNPSEAGLYSRIDITYFSNMEPYGWGFCLTAYDAKNISAAESAPPADRNNPRKGCGGFPFSRMKRDIRD